MSKNYPTQSKPSQDPAKTPAFQQFTAGEACMPTPEPPYDVEKVRGDKINPAPKPSKAEGGS